MDSTPTRDALRINPGIDSTPTWEALRTRSLSLSLYERYQPIQPLSVLHIMIQVVESESIHIRADPFRGNQRLRL
jgi:hypothetical protein